MVPALVLALALVPTPGRASDEYVLRLRFERGPETRLYESNVRLGEPYTTVLRSSGAKEEALVVDVMAFSVEDAPERIEVTYQVEWAVDGAVLQAQDAAELSLREDVLLAELSGEWSIRGSASPLSGVDTGTPPPSGGGLLAVLRVVRGKFQRRLVRRTKPYVMSNALFRARPGVRPFNVGLEFQPTGADRPVVVRYAFELAGETLGGVTSRAELAYGVETLIEGDGAPDGVWLTVGKVPVIACKNSP